MKILLVIALLGLAGPACSKDSRSELDAWRAEACACESSQCAEKARKRFWTLVQKFRDDKPSKEQARALNAIVDKGQHCLSKLDVDIYALR